MTYLFLQSGDTFSHIFPERKLISYTQVSLSVLDASVRMSSGPVFLLLLYGPPVSSLCRCV